MKNFLAILAITLLGFQSIPAQEPDLPEEKIFEMLVNHMLTNLQQGKHPEVPPPLLQEETLFGQEETPIPEEERNLWLQREVKPLMRAHIQTKTISKKEEEGTMILTMETPLLFGNIHMEAKIQPVGGTSKRWFLSKIKVEK